MPTYEIKLEVVSTHTVVVHHNEENEEDLWVDNDAKLLELAKKKIAGEECMKKNNKKIILIDLLESKSTSSIINKISET